MGDYYVTKKAAESGAASKNAVRPSVRGRSSGHAHVDYVVKRGPGKIFRRWQVVERSV